MWKIEWYEQKQKNVFEFKDPSEINPKKDELEKRGILSFTIIPPNGEKLYFGEHTRKKG